ncbi:cd7 antigen-like [Triplophysa dalaica]|uniref:cd7 antigen-like n=1 Tax=Triplophysa dalaica TaxID=1582913 RepID=UPI0024DFC778|nr:cd7 antigen-like [Triplophysa dalaica]
MVVLNYAQVILLFLTTSITVHEDCLYFHRRRNSSVDISCESSQKEEKLFAFSLKRRLLQSREVLYLNKGNTPYFNISEDKDRITVLDRMDNHTVHLRISNLQVPDTDVYYCEFYYGDLPYHKNIPAKMEYFIHVEDISHEPCSCISYLPLLYVISAAVCLLGVVVITFASVYYCKSAKKKPEPVVPVYEEMTGVRTDKKEINGCQMDITKQQDTNSSFSALLSKENPYVMPESTKCD